jgi:zinc resistance-associated protein
MANCPKAARANPEIQGKIQQFYRDTEGLRKQIFTKRAELSAVVNAAQPDPATAGKIAGELYDLQASLRKQAQAAGLGQFRPGMGMGRGMGMGGGSGRGFGNW